MTPEKKHSIETRVRVFEEICDTPGERIKVKDGGQEDQRVKEDDRGSRPTSSASLTTDDGADSSAKSEPSQNILFRERDSTFTPASGPQAPNTKRQEALPSLRPPSARLPVSCSGFVPDASCGQTSNIRHPRSLSPFSLTYSALPPRQHIPKLGLWGWHRRVSEQDRHREMDNNSGRKGPIYPSGSTNATFSPTVRRSITRGTWFLCEHRSSSPV
ncbi:hypothetical protein LZ32DRAFT_58562 [Colletotrichum eremochloae]|nr:hypothetical protein LZ32DRAFT_58562 [Colletotrichum eremochloae]